MRLKKLLGAIAGVTVTFFLFSLWKGGLNWYLWVASLIGVIIGHSVIVLVGNRIKEISNDE